MLGFFPLSFAMTSDELGAPVTGRLGLITPPAPVIQPVETPEERALRIKRERDEMAVNLGFAGLGVALGFFAERGR